MSRSFYVSRHLADIRRYHKTSTVEEIKLNTVEDIPSTIWKAVRRALTVSRQSTLKTLCKGIIH